jgi:phage FluMu protein Com
MSQPFTFKNVRWHRNQRSGATTAIAAADVTCTACGHTWSAEPADLEQAGLVGALRVRCPSCKTVKAVPYPDM